MTSMTKTVIPISDILSCASICISCYSLYYLYYIHNEMNDKMKMLEHDKDYFTYKYG